MQGMICNDFGCIVPLLYIEDESDAVNDKYDNVLPGTLISTASDPLPVVPLKLVEKAPEDQTKILSRSSPYG